MSAPKIMEKKQVITAFQNVPAGVCQQYGEKYLTAKLAKEIEQRIQTKEK